MEAIENYNFYNQLKPDITQKENCQVFDWSYNLTPVSVQYNQNIHHSLK